MIKLSKLTIANDASRPLAVNQSLSLSEGTLTALIGRNGCGKSTLLRTLAGIQKPLAGTVYIGGIDVNRATSRDIAETIAVITTESVKVANLTCRELVAYGRSPHTGFLGRLSADDERIIDDALQSVGMQSFAGRKVSQISDGESRRILLARAIAQQTPVILLDEPTSFLDVPGRYEICSLLARLAHAQGKTIVYSTHELEPAFLNADNILLMSESGLTLLPPGQMRQSESFCELFTPKGQQDPRA
ncbi:MAG: ABC transporter ATP-binding protein [Muribaculaceae bacterium]|nr:ABC transporter ATP-binding protein [Muribaculaceae bacterium]